MDWVLTPRDLSVWGHLEAGSLQRKLNYIRLLGIGPNPTWLMSLWEDNHHWETVPITYLVAVTKYQTKLLQEGRIFPVLQFQSRACHNGDCGYILAAGVWGTCPQEAESGERGCHSLLPVQPWTLPHPTGPLTFRLRVSLPSSGKPSWKHP